MTPILDRFERPAIVYICPPCLLRRASSNSYYPIALLFYLCLCVQAGCGDYHELLLRLLRYGPNAQRTPEVLKTRLTRSLDSCMA